MRIGSVFSFNGRVDRKTYAIVGLLGLAIKQNLDRFVGVHVFHYEESFFNYWRPLGKAARLMGYTPLVDFDEGLRRTAEFLLGG